MEKEEYDKIWKKAIENYISKLAENVVMSLPIPKDETDGDRENHYENMHSMVEELEDTIELWLDNFGSVDVEPVESEITGYTSLNYDDMTVKDTRNGIKVYQEIIDMARNMMSETGWIHSGELTEVVADRLEDSPVSRETVYVYCVNALKYGVEELDVFEQGKQGRAGCYRLAR